MKNIVIIIDPWRRSLGARLLFFIPAKFISAHYWMFKNIKKLVESDQNIDTVIFASYDQETRPIDNLYLKWNTKKTSMWITEEFKINKILLENKVEKIFMCGSSWDRCVKNRPLGYKNLKKIIDDNNLDTGIYVKKDCVVDMKNRNFIPEENLDWLETDTKEIYKYNL